MKSCILFNLMHWNKLKTEIKWIKTIQSYKKKTKLQNKIFKNIFEKEFKLYKQKIFFYLLLNAKEDISKHFECFIVFCTKSFDLCQSWKKIVINVCNLG